MGTWDWGVSDSSFKVRRLEVFFSLCQTLKEVKEGALGILEDKFLAEVKASSRGRSKPGK